MDEGKKAKPKILPLNINPREITVSQVFRMLNYQIDTDIEISKGNAFLNANN
jgi:hypothetical protein